MNADHDLGSDNRVGDEKWYEWRGEAGGYSREGGGRGRG